MLTVKIATSNAEPLTAAWIRAVHKRKVATPLIVVPTGSWNSIVARALDSIDGKERLNPNDVGAYASYGICKRTAITTLEAEVRRAVPNPCLMPAVPKGHTDLRGTPPGPCCYRSHKRLPAITTESSLFNISSLLLENGPLCTQDANHALRFLHALQYRKRSADRRCRKTRMITQRSIENGVSRQRDSGDVQINWS